MSDPIATNDATNPLDRRMGMSALLARNWWLIALRGVVAIVFALSALILPLATLGSLVLVLGIYLLVDGGAGIASGLYAATHDQRWVWLILEGLVGIVAGLVALAMPGLTLAVLISILGAWAIISGAMMLVAAFRLHGGHGGWLLAIAGIASIVWGGLLWVYPIVASVVLVTWLGIYAMVFGITLLIFAFRLRSRHSAPGGPYAAA